MFIDGLLKSCVSPGGTLTLLTRRTGHKDNGSVFSFFPDGDTTIIHHWGKHRSNRDEAQGRENDSNPVPDRDE